MEVKREFPNNFLWGGATSAYQCCLLYTSDFMNYVEGCDLVLVGPQIRHEIPRIKRFVEPSVPVVSMNPSHYGLMNAKGVIEDVKKIMKERK